MRIKDYAYLVGVIATDEKPPRYMGASIFSDSNPTLGGDRWSFVIAQASGDSYGEAKENLEKLLNMKMYQWARPVTR